MSNPDMQDGLAPRGKAMGRKSTTNPERSAATKAKLMAATIEALHQFGYAATTTIMVAKMADVSRGAMLHHFPNKVSLMLACMNETYEAERAYYRQKLLPIKDPAERAFALVDAAWDCFRSPTGVARTEIWLATRSDPELAAQLLPLYREDLIRSRKAMRAFLSQAGLKDEAFADGFLTFSVATCRGLAMSAALGTDEAQIQRSVDMIKDQLRLKLSALS